MLNPQVGISVVGPRIFATVLEFLWRNCSPVCISPTWQLCGSANGDPSKGTYAAHPTSRTAAALCLLGDTQTLTGRSGSVSCGVTAPSSGSWCTQSCVCTLQASLVGMGLILNVTAPLLLSCCSFSFALGSLVVQWLKFGAPLTEWPALIPGRGGLDPTCCK